MKHFRLLILLLALTLAACGQKEAPTPTPLPTTDPAVRQQRALEALWMAVNDQFIYDDFGGADWNALQAEYKTRIAGGLSNMEFEESLNSLVSNLPAGSAVYQTRSERIQAELENTALYSGIGAYISVRAEPEPHIVILSIIKDSPAAEAGLAAHDSIYSVDGGAVTAEEGLTVVQRVRGDAGTTVTLEVESPGGARRTVTVTRAKLTAADTLKGGLLTQSGILYLLVPVSPEATLLEAMAQGLTAASQQTQLTGIIIDLRIAHAGAGWPLTEMLTLYGDGPLGEFYTRDEEQPLAANGVDVSGSQTLPLVVLVGPDTEGSPEIFAAALQASNRAKIIGMPTAGKVFGFSDVALPDGSLLTLATSSYKTSAGRDLARFGVKPDTTVDADWDEVSPSSDPALEKAIEILTPHD